VKELLENHQTMRKGGEMLTAYWDLGLQIKDLPVDDPRVPEFPFEKLSSAKSILAKAKLARPEIQWEIKEKSGSYSVREKQS
jgi:hypothetical protein